jgi:serine/threonine protein kinase
MRDFLRICLVKDPVLRPASDELMTHPWITNNNGEAEQQTARDAFLKLLLDYRSKKQLEPETILLRAGTMLGGAPNTSVLEPSNSGYVEVNDTKN